MPEYSEDLGSHIFYLYDFVKKAAEQIDILLIIEKCNVREVGGPFKKVYVQRFNGILRCFESFWLLLLARVQGYNNFYIHYSYIGAINASLISRLSGARTFYWSCGMMWLFEKPFKLKWNILKEKLVHEWPLRLILKASNYLVTGNETMKSEYHKHYGISLRRIKVMPNWIDLDRFDPAKFNKENLKTQYGVPDDKKVVLFVHHLSERKGADLIPQIAAGFKDRGDVLFLICGSGPYESKLKQETKEKGIENVVRFEGAVPNKLIPEYFAMADVFLMPSREEGFPRVLLESMAMNVPYVASDVGGVREMTPRSLEQYFVKIGSTAVKFIDKIKEVLSVDNIDIRLGIENYSTDSVIRYFIKLFDQYEEK